jgi:hypothetical protein
MHDLELGRRVVAGTATAAELTAIAGVATRPTRWLLNAIAARVDDADAGVREAALRALAGVRVCRRRAIVARLDDDDASVRTAALGALRETARGGTASLRPRVVPSPPRRAAGGARGSPAGARAVAGTCARSSVRRASQRAAVASRCAAVRV